MLNSGVLDVVTGLVFIFLLYSLLATLVQEIIATNFGFRSKILERAVFRMLEDENKFESRFKSIFYLFKRSGNGGRANSATNTFYKHPLIRFLGENDGHKKPSYIKKETFAKVMIDLLRGENVKPGDDVAPLIQQSLEAKRTSWGKAGINEATNSYLSSIWTDAKGDVEKFREYLENWFDLTMDRASGWYKKHVQVILFFIGFAIAVIFNVDTIVIVDKLEKDPTLREQLVQQADVFARAYPNLDDQIFNQEKEIKDLDTKTQANGVLANDSLKDKLTQAKDNLEKYNSIQTLRNRLLNRADSLINIDIHKANDIVGIGINSYGQTFHKMSCFIKSLIGWLITALALSLGAPFWFDILNKLMKLRSSISTEKSEKNDI